MRLREEEDRMRHPGDGGRVFGPVMLLHFGNGRSGFVPMPYGVDHEQWSSERQSKEIQGRIKFEQELAEYMNDPDVDDEAAF